MHARHQLDAQEEEDDAVVGGAVVRQQTLHDTLNTTTHITCAHTIISVMKHVAVMCHVPHHFGEVLHCDVRLPGDVVEGVVCLKQPAANHPVNSDVIRSLTSLFAQSTTKRFAVNDKCLIQHVFGLYVNVKNLNQLFCGASMCAVVTYLRHDAGPVDQFSRQVGQIGKNEQGQGLHHCKQISVVSARTARSVQEQRAQCKNSALSARTAHQPTTSPTTPVVGQPDSFYCCKLYSV